MATSIGMLILLLIDATVHLDSKHFVDALTREEWEMLDRIENPNLYE